MLTKADLKEFEHRLDQRLNAIEHRLDTLATKADLQIALATLRDELKSHTNRQTMLLGAFLGLLVTLLHLLG